MATQTVPYNAIGIIPALPSLTLEYPQTERYSIRFPSLMREAQNKQGAPFAGFPVPGFAPIAVPRKLLKSCLAGLANARITIIHAAKQNEVSSLRIESLDGRRKYVLYCKHAEIRKTRSEAQREVIAFAKRKQSSIAAKNGWKRVVSFDEETGERSEWHEKNGLRVQGRVLLHAASGKSVLTADNRSQAFVWAEHALAKFPDWTQDAESVMLMLGESGRSFMRSIRFSAKYSAVRS